MSKAISGDSAVRRTWVWIATWAMTFFASRFALEISSLPAGVRIAAALLPVPVGLGALIGLVRLARRLDELEQRIHLEALATAFVLAVVLLMSLGLMELAVPLDPADWSLRHVWAMLPLLYLSGLALARRRYT